MTTNSVLGVQVYKQQYIVVIEKSDQFSRVPPSQMTTPTPTNVNLSVLSVETPHPSDSCTLRAAAASTRYMPVLLPSSKYPFHRKSAHRRQSPPRRTAMSGSTRGPFCCERCFRRSRIVCDFVVHQSTAVRTYVASKRCRCGYGWMDGVRRAGKRG